MTRAGTLVLDWMKLSYRETGKPDGLPVVLLHATGSRASTWDRFAAALAAEGRHAIALDLRGHGASSRTPRYSVELMVDDVLRFLDSRKLSLVDLVGHSLGGFVALFLAAREPRRVRRMVIEDVPGPLRDNESADDGRPVPPAEPLDPVDFDWRLVRPIFSDVRTPHPGFWDQAPLITARTLLVAGGPTSHVDQARIDALAVVLPDAKVITIDAGHRIHSTSPDEFARAVVPFLAD